MNSATAGEAGAIWLDNYFSLAAVVLLLYDHLLTFPAEVALIWSRPRSLSAVCFLLNRYLNAAANTVAAVYGFRNLDDHGCRVYAAFRMWLVVGSQAVIGGFLVARTYALYNCSRRFLAQMLCATTTLLVLACICVHLQSKDAVEVVYGLAGCRITISHRAGIYLAMAWECLLLFDVLIFVLTVRQTWRLGRRTWPARSPPTPLSFSSGGFSTRRRARARWRDRWRYMCGSVSGRVRPGADAQPQRMDIVTLLQRDGAIYFGAMALANIANILPYYFAEPLLKRLIGPIASTLSVALISRLMLNLRATAVPRSPGPGELPLPSHTTAGPRAHGHGHTQAGANADASGTTSADDGIECGVFTSRFDIDPESAAVLRWSLVDEEWPPASPITVGEADIADGAGAGAGVATAAQGQAHDRDRVSEYGGGWRDRLGGTVR